MAMWSLATAALENAFQDFMADYIIEYGIEYLLGPLGSAAPALHTPRCFSAPAYSLSGQNEKQRWP